MDIQGEPESVEGHYARLTMATMCQVKAQNREGLPDLQGMKGNKYIYAMITKGLRGILDQLNVYLK